MKTCAQCKLDKPYTDFYFNKSSGSYTSKCKVCYSSSRSQYRKAYKKANPESVKDEKHRYYEKHKEKIRDRRRAKNTEYDRRKRKEDPMYRLKSNLRRMIRLCLSKGGYTKKSKTQCVLGCEYTAFQKHIELQFLPGMSWDLIGREIHIDHIVPLASATCEDDLIKLNHYTNLRPLWASDNLAKGCRQDYLI